jgi:hypothetical protein
VHHTDHNCSSHDQNFLLNNATLSNVSLIRWSASCKFMFSHVLSDVSAKRKVIHPIVIIKLRRGLPLTSINSSISYFQSYMHLSIWLWLSQQSSTLQRASLYLDSIFPKKSLNWRVIPFDLTNFVILRHFVQILYWHIKQWYIIRYWFVVFMSLVISEDMQLWLPTKLDASWVTSPARPYSVISRLCSTLWLIHIDLQEDVDWIQLAQDREQWWVFQNTVMKLQGLLKGREFD